MSSGLQQAPTAATAMMVSPWRPRGCFGRTERPQICFLFLLMSGGVLFVCCVKIEVVGDNLFYVAYVAFGRLGSWWRGNM